MKSCPPTGAGYSRWYAEEKSFHSDADLKKSKKLSVTLCHRLLMRLKKERRKKMFIPPNQPENIRKWAYCCAKINILCKVYNVYSRYGITTHGEYYRTRSGDYRSYCRRKCHFIARRIARYGILRDKTALQLANPRKHLLNTDEMLSLIGNIIDITPRHSKKQQFCSLYECSSDGELLNDEFDAMTLLSFGYGSKN